MKKKIVLRGIMGFPIGIALGYLITIGISLCEANGLYLPCVPELASVMGNELYAVCLQALLCGLLGSGFGASSVIWEIEQWSLVKQTGIYFVIISLMMLPIAYVTYWMERSMIGIIRYFAIFLIIFLVIWIIQFGWGTHNVRRMNDNLHQVKNNIEQ